MSSDILVCLGLDNELQNNKIIIMKEVNGCDSSFVSSYVLGNCIKNKKAVFVILTHNSILHYHNIGLKMNYNLQKAIDSGLVQFYNVGEEFVDILLEKEEFSSQDLFHNIKARIMSMKEKHHSVNIIFDGASHLFDLHFTIKDVNSVFSAIINMLREFDNSFLLCHCNVANENDVTHVFANLLAHKAHTIVEVESLSSGWSVDVSGHLTIKYPSRKFEEQGLFLLHQKSSQYLFKLFDRGVKLFAPGTV